MTAWLVLIIYQGETPYQGSTCSSILCRPNIKSTIPLQQIAICLLQGWGKYQCRYNYEQLSPYNAFCATSKWSLCSSTINIISRSYQSARTELVPSTLWTNSNGIFQWWWKVALCAQLSIVSQHTDCLACSNKINIKLPLTQLLWTINSPW